MMIPGRLDGFKLVHIWNSLTNMVTLDSKCPKTINNTISTHFNENFSSSWEVPALIENKIAYVSDSDGVSYPWYGSGTEIATVKGPTDHYTEVKVK